MIPVVQRLLYRYGWDTRSRNVVPAQVLRPVLKQSPEQPRPLLDVGCGYLGLASFLPSVSVAGVDLEVPAATPANLEFQRGSVMALPFEDNSFPVVSCIDVLEHLSLIDRSRAVSELVRVASMAVLIACPHGATAQACDDEFRRASRQRGRPVPGWVDEHLANPYPDPEMIKESLESAASAKGRGARVSLSFCEPLAGSRLIRSVAARSPALYVAVNLMLGIMLPLFPAPRTDKSYRMILLTEFTAPGA